MCHMSGKERVIKDKKLTWFSWLLQILYLLKFSGPVRNITFDVYNRSKNKIHSTFQSVFTVLTGTIAIIGRVPLCNYHSVYLSFRFFLSFSLATGDLNQNVAKKYTLCCLAGKQRVLKISKLGFCASFLINTPFAYMVNTDSR